MIDKYWRRNFSSDNSSRLARRAIPAKCDDVANTRCNWNARRCSITRRSIYSIKCGIYGIPIQLIAFVDCMLLYISSTYLDVLFQTRANGTMTTDKHVSVEGEWDQPFVFQSTTEIKAVPREKKRKKNKLLKYLAK